MSIIGLARAHRPYVSARRKAEPAIRKAKAKQPLSARMQRHIRMQHISALLLGTVAAAMTTVPLSQIAGGAEHITHAAVPAWQAWGVAIGLPLLARRSPEPARARTRGHRRQPENPAFKAIRHLRFSPALSKNSSIPLHHPGQPIGRKSM
jgi:hypothetical protein